MSKEVNLKLYCNNPCLKVIFTANLIDLMHFSDALPEEILH